MDYVSKFVSTLKDRMSVLVVKGLQDRNTFVKVYA